MSNTDTQKKKQAAKKSSVTAKEEKAKSASVKAAAAPSESKTRTVKKEKKTAVKPAEKPTEIPAKKDTAAAKTAPKDAPKDAPEKAKKSDGDKSAEEKQSTGSAPESESHKPVPKEFLADLNQLAEAFAQNPGLVDPVREVFEYHLVDPLDRKTFPKIVNAMSMLLGSSATMVVMTATHVNNPAFFEDLLAAINGDEKARNAVWTLQHLTAIYGNRVHEAYSLSSGTIDEDWHSIDINTYKRGGEQPLYQICLDIAQYSGAEVHLKMTPESTFQLISILSEELAYNVPLDQIDPELIEKCRKNHEDYFHKYYADADGEAEKKEEDPAGYA